MIRHKLCFGRRVAAPRFGKSPRALLGSHTCFCVYSTAMSQGKRPLGNATEWRQEEEDKGKYVWVTSFGLHCSELPSLLRSVLQLSNETQPRLWASRTLGTSMEMWERFDWDVAYHSRARRDRGSSPVSQRRLWERQAVLLQAGICALTTQSQPDCCWEPTPDIWRPGGSLMSFKTQRLP